LGLGGWWYFNEDRIDGTSFWGNSGSIISWQDFPSYAFDTPFWTIPGSGGSDVLTLVDPGVYLLVFTIITSASSLYTPNTLPACTLTGVTVVSSSENFDVPSNYRVLSYAIVSNSYGGTIGFPTSSGLVTLYGAGWSLSALYEMTVVRLS